MFSDPRSIRISYQSKISLKVFSWQIELLRLIEMLSAQPLNTVDDNTTQIKVAELKVGIRFCIEIYCLFHDNTK